MNVGALPVVEAAPRGQYQYPLLGLQQGLQEGGDANVDIPAEVETLRGVDVIQKIPGREEDSGASARGLGTENPGDAEVLAHPGAFSSF